VTLPLEQVAELSGNRVLVTGASGSIGAALLAALRRVNIGYLATDLPGTGVLGMDVRDYDSVRENLDAYEPGLVFHLAAAKHAPEGEDDPWEVCETNVRGTRTVLNAAAQFGWPRVVLASTCKACDPETAYGASKLIAERMTLNAGGSVARFYNVRESSGNVFRIWEALPDGEPLPVTPCSRYFISIDDAVELLLWAAVLGPGRFSVVPGEPEPMLLAAHRFAPGRAIRPIPPRRGDRIAEPLLGGRETTLGPYAGGASRIVQVVSPHDVVPAPYDLTPA
jgi:FlaA1/EpsC-like NDP-sugar epimerase